MSTKRKKKTETEKVSPLTDKGYYVSFDPALMGHYRRGRNPLDDELASEDAMMARDLKTMRVEELNMKRRKRMAKLQKEIDKLEKEGEKIASDDSGVPRISMDMAAKIAQLTPEEQQKVIQTYSLFRSVDQPHGKQDSLLPLLIEYAKSNLGASDTSKVPGISISMARQIAKLPQEEQQKVIQTYALFRSIDQPHGRQDSLLPLLIGFSRSNPGTSDSQMVTYAKAMSDQFKTGIDVMKTVMPPQEKASNATEVLKLFKDLVTDSVKKPMEQLVKNLQPQPSAFEQIILNPEMRSVAKEMGMFGGREKTGSTTSDTDLKIEQLRTERDLSLKKLDLEWKKDMLKRESEDRRTDAIVSALTPLSALFAGPINQRMRQFGQQQAAAHAPTSGVPPMGNTVIIRCPCGYQGTKTFPGAMPSSFSCPQCGEDLVVGGAPSGGEPQEPDTGT